MRSSQLNSFFANRITAIDFRSIIDAEVKNYSRLMDKKGSAIPLNLIEDENIYLDQAKFKKLLSETINENLSIVHLAYICDCLTLAEIVLFANEQIDTYIHSIADPEINGGYKSISELREIVST